MSEPLQSVEWYCESAAIEQIAPACALYEGLFAHHSDEHVPTENAFFIAVVAAADSIYSVDRATGRSLIWVTVRVEFSYAHEAYDPQIMNQIFGDIAKAMHKAPPASSNIKDYIGFANMPENESGGSTNDGQLVTLQRTYRWLVRPAAGIVSELV